MRPWIVGLSIAGVLGGLAAGYFALRSTSGASDWTPQSREGRELYARARRDVWPEHVLASPAKYRDVLVVWSGVVREHQVTPDGQQLRTVLDHHYWDFSEGRGAQRERYFLSPRGEGAFTFEEPNTPQAQRPAYLPVGAMAVIFGNPVGVTPGGEVTLELQWAITIPARSFATDVWDYGRPYVEQHDQTDLKVLRKF